MKNQDLLIIGAIGVGVVLLYPQIKKLWGGVSDAADGVSSAVSGTGAAIQGAGGAIGRIGGQVGDLFNEGYLTGMLDPRFRENVSESVSRFRETLSTAPPLTTLSPIARTVQTIINPVSSPNLINAAAQVRALKIQSPAPNTSTPTGAVYSPPPTTYTQLPAPNTSTPTGAIYSPPPTTYTQSYTPNPFIQHALLLKKIDPRGLMPTTQSIWKAAGI